MARQVRTQQDQNQVAADFDLFSLPFDASLDVQGRTVYGTTDPTVNLSMVNIRHLNATRLFRGAWTAVPTDGTIPTPYQDGQIVVGSDDHLYRLTTGGTPATDPTTAGQTDWVLVGGRNLTVTELRSVPETRDVNLFAGSQTVTFDISPAPGTTLQNPTVTSSVAGITPTVTTAGRVSVDVPNQTTNTPIIITTVAEAVDAQGTIYQASAVESVINLVDARIQPTVTPEIARVSIIDTSQAFDYTVTRLPTGAALADGTGYDVDFRLGSSGLVQTGNTIRVPTIITDTDFTFTFPLVGTPTNGQVGTPDDITRTLTTYTPWFWGFSPTVPTGMAGLTEGVYTGQTQGNDFVSNMSFSVTGTTGAVNTFWLAVPTSISNNIVLSTGLANVPGVRTTNTFDIPNALNSGNINYTLHRFLVGLVMSPTVFTIAITS